MHGHSHPSLHPFESSYNHGKVILGQKVKLKLQTCMDSTSVESTRWKKSSFADSSCGENALVKANGVVC